MKRAMTLAMKYLILLYKRKVNFFGCHENSKPIYVQKPKLQHKQMSKDSLQYQEKSLELNSTNICLL